MEIRAESATIPNVEGLIYVKDWLSVEEELEIVKKLDHPDKCWSNDLKRRVQQYGYKFNYVTRSLDMESNVGPLPDFLQSVGNRLKVRLDRSS